MSEINERPALTNRGWGTQEMKNLTEKFVPEPERYELRSKPLHHFELDRRDFFKLLGTGIAIFAVAKDSLTARRDVGIKPFLAKF